MLKSTCTNVLEEVKAKLDTLPSKSSTSGNSNSVGDISRIFDSYIDKDKRKMNVVVHNLPEEEGTTLAERAAKDQVAFQAMVMEALNLRVETTMSFRAGKKIPEKPRLLIVTISTIDAKLDLLRMASQLRNTQWKHIFIHPDMSKQEREQGKKMRQESWARRQAGEENLIIR